jgi:hypothetical protein
LDKLGCELKDDLIIDVILQSPPTSYDPFIINFHMNGMEKTVAELHGMLKTGEDSIKKNPNHTWRDIDSGTVGRHPRIKTRKIFSMSP